MTAFGETISIAFSGSPSIVARRLLSLLAACAVLAVGLPAALGGGVWNGGVDTGRFFGQDAPAPAAKPPPPR